MKNAKKIKIINWHYFWNETLDLDSIVFLTGQNASGKSTIIDAMQLLLLGDTSGRYFNKAATEKSARTLKGYLRCELGDDEGGGFKYLRTGRFTSYVAMEFYDDKNDNFFTLGIVFDSFSDGSEEHRFFYLEAAIPENGFIVDEVPMEYKTLNAFFNENYAGKYRFLDTNRQYQELIKKKFGGLKDKYFSLFKKAVSFSPITDIETFITEYVCDSQANINISSMQENILQYKKLETEASIMKLRVERLTEIEKAYQNYIEQTKNLNLYSYIIERAEYQNDLNRINSYQNQITKAKLRLKEIEGDIEGVNQEIANFTKKREKLISEKLTSDTYKMTDELLESQKETETELRTLEVEVGQVTSNLRKYADSFIEVATNLVSSLAGEDISLFEEGNIEELLGKAKKVIDTSTLLKDEKLLHFESLQKETLVEWRDALQDFKNTISASHVSLGRTITQLDQKTALLRQQENNLRNGGKTYERTLAILREELAKELSKRHGKNIEVAIFADLIDIKTPLWVNAVEGFLYGPKFNFFVEPQYYLEAYDILKDLLKTIGYSSTTIVDQAKIIEKDFTFDKGSLAEEITTKHQGARVYANYLLGRLMKCQTTSEARQSGNGITPECDIYRNFSLGAINPRHYQIGYIGQKISDRQINAKHLEVEQNIKMVALYRTIYRLLGDANSLEIINSNEIANSLQVIEKAQNIAGLQENLAYINSELKKHDLSQIVTFDQRIAAIEEDIRGLETDKSRFFEEKGQLANQVSTLQTEKIPEEEVKAREREERLQSKYDPFFVDEVASPAFTAFLNEGKTTLEIVTEYKVRLSKTQYVEQNLYGQVVKLRKDYIRDYRLSYDAEGKDNTVYDNELQEMRDVKLPQYQVAILDAYNKATKQFKDDFINKLKTAIETVEAQIEDLNKALEASTFGDDSYYFVVSPSSQYRRYYDMIKDELLLEVGEDDSLFVSKYEEVMTDLFKQIVDTGANGDSNSAVLANVDKFTDYRSYLEFDLIVKNRDGSEQRLSKTLRKKSGGETQTPFYISVLASFAQLYRVYEKGELGNSFRLIIFDEAFSKMDRGRIKESVRLLRKFGLQAILSAPSDKIGDISELVDRTLVVYHGKNSSTVKLFAKETN